MRWTEYGLSTVMLGICFCVLLFLNCFCFRVLGVGGDYFIQGNSKHIKDQGGGTRLLDMSSLTWVFI